MKIYPETEMHNIQLCWLNGFRRIFALRQVMLSGLQPATEVFKTIHHTQLGQTFKDEPDILRQGDVLASLAAAMTGSTLEQARLTSDAACLVFAHTLLDAAVDGYLKVIFQFMPAEWEYKIKNNEVTLKVSDLRGKTSDELVAEQLRIEFVKSTNKPLPKKVELLQGFCREAFPLRFPESYKYDPTQMLRLTIERNDVVHGRDLHLKQREHDFNSDLNFMFGTAEYCSVLVGKRLNLPIQDFRLMK